MCVYAFMCVTRGEGVSKCMCMRVCERSSVWECERKCMRMIPFVHLFELVRLIYSYRFFSNKSFLEETWQLKA